MAPAPVYGGESGFEWMAQLQQMREAIAAFKLSHSDGDAIPYGQDIPVDDQNSSSDRTGDDIWDLLSDSEHEVSSDNSTDAPSSHLPSNGMVSGDSHDTQWLVDLCAEKTNVNSGFGPEELLEQLSVLLASDMSGKAQIFPEVITLISRRRGATN